MPPLNPSKPIGRGREYDRLVGQISIDHPAIVVVSGPPGSGRTDIVRRLATVADEMQFHCLGVNEQLVVERATKLSDILRVLEAQPRVERPAQNSSTSRSGWLKTVFELAESRIESANTEKNLLQRLARLAPLYLAVEGYRPSPTFDSWIRNRLAPWIRREQIAIMLIITGSPREVASISDIADVTIELGSLDLPEVVEFFKSQFSSIEPPGSTTEIQQYANAAASQPSLVSAFQRVLSAIEEGDGSGTS